MNTITLESHWDELKGELKSAWGKLTNDDIKEVAGKKDKLFAILKKHYGYGKEKAQEELDAFLQKLDHHQPGQVISDSIRHLGDKAQSLTHDLADKSEAYLAKGGELSQQAQQAVQNNCDTVTNFVKEHPVQTALIAAGVGLLLGKLLK